MGGGFTLNVSVTLAIAGRLWWTSRTIASLTGTSINRFASSIYLIVESGAISAAALAPFLIIVQLGVISRYRNPSADSFKTVRTAQDGIIFRVGSRREQDSPTDVPLHLAVYDTL
ncbi:hypothetical protein JVT61DRAFT_1503 [Boletus reticuloceps]|uniref:Uncharacterized protein n=1 Tax=Boletus reticuloceps TaxID=495285 RepID=A0A8I2YBZ1_9AGAM|nr:hypothetical protein JVT61DRAFT_1503 [Boletus reticuloceps]